MSIFSRTELLLGKDAVQRLKKASVAVFGVGGVGSYCAEALARGGIGRIDLVDSDRVCLSNINRQIIATHETVEQPKVEVMRRRMLAINPEVRGQDYQLFYTADNAGAFDLTPYDYVADAIDTVSAKISLVERASLAGVRIISSMGAGNKLDPTRFEVADIYQTTVCPLARVMRTELRKRNIPSLKVVYSKEPPGKPQGFMEAEEENSVRRQTPGSISFVPSVAGLIMAGEIIKDIAGIR